MGGGRIAFPKKRARRGETKPGGRVVLEQEVTAYLLSIMGKNTSKDDGPD